MEAFIKEEGRKEARVNQKDRELIRLMLIISFVMLGCSFIQFDFLYFYGYIITPVGIGLFIAEMHKDYHAKLSDS